jgi:peptide methionine sulfoxide reductase MsrB
VCAIGNLPLFDSRAKFEAHVGWPNFSKPIDRQHVLLVKDTRIPLLTRTELVCARSGAHLGHLHYDGATSLQLQPQLSFLQCKTSSLQLPSDGWPEIGVQIAQQHASAGPGPDGARYCVNAGALKFLTRKEFRRLPKER